MGSEIISPRLVDIFTTLREASSQNVFLSHIFGVFYNAWFLHLETHSCEICVVHLQVPTILLHLLKGESLRTGFELSHNMLSYNF